MRLQISKFYIETHEEKPTGEKLKFIKLREEVLKQFKLNRTPKDCELEIKTSIFDSQKKHPAHPKHEYQSENETQLGICLMIYNL